MRMPLDKPVPKDGVEFEEKQNFLKITMYRNVRNKGQATADVVCFTMPLGSVEKVDIVAHFEYYFSKAKTAETKKCLEIKRGK